MERPDGIMLCEINQRVEDCMSHLHVESRKQKLMDKENRLMIARRNGAWRWTK